MTRIAVIGSVSVDMALRTPQIPRPGENVYGFEFKMGAGGKGANAATAIARLGGKALIVGCIGDDELGDLELSVLKAERVDTSTLTIVPGVATDVVCVMVVEGGQNAVLAISSTNRLLTGAAVAAALRPHWGQLDAVVANFECHGSAISTAIQLSTAHDIPVVVDAGPICDHSPEVWSRATVLSPNIQEALFLGGVENAPQPEENTIRMAARRLLARGPRAVVVKMGDKGALLVTEDEEHVIPAFQVEAVDTTGAGDAFTAALTLALARGMELAAAVRYANAAGALATTRFGALEAMPTAAELGAFYSNR